MFLTIILILYSMYLFFKGWLLLFNAVVLDFLWQAYGTEQHKANKRKTYRTFGKSLLMFLLAGVWNFFFMF